VTAFSTWSDPKAIDGNVLAIINVKRDDRDAAAALFDQLGGGLASGALYVIAEPGWAPWLEGRGISGDRVCLATDVAGQPLELYYFLERPHAIAWIKSKAFRTVVGAAPHSLYNDQVNGLFEERLCLFLGSGRLVAHTLPSDFLYVFDLPMLLRRLGRDSKVQEYRATTRAIVDDWHGQWVAAGRPAGADGGSAAAMMSSMRRHWPVAERSGDETHALEPAGADAAQSMAPLVGFLDGVIEEYARRLVNPQAEYGRGVAIVARINLQINRLRRLLKRRPSA